MFRGFLAAAHAHGIIHREGLQELGEVREDHGASGSRYPGEPEAATIGPGAAVGEAGDVMVGGQPARRAARAAANNCSCSAPRTCNQRRIA